MNWWQRLLKRDKLDRQLDAEIRDHFERRLDLWIRLSETPALVIHDVIHRRYCVSSSPMRHPFVKTLGNRMASLGWAFYEGRFTLTLGEKRGKLQSLRS